MGMLSRAASRVRQIGQCEGGVISDMPSGSRHTTTFRKLPMHAPSAKTNRITTTCWATDMLVCCSTGVSPVSVFQKKARARRPCHTSLASRAHSQHARDVHADLFHAQVRDLQLGGHHLAV